MWLLLTKAWRKFKDSTPKPTATKRFLQHIIGEYAVEYPNICNQILTLMEIWSETGSLERSFTKLLKMCYKGRCETSSNTSSKATKICGRKQESYFKKSNHVCLDNIFVLSFFWGALFMDIILGAILQVLYCLVLFSVLFCGWKDKLYRSLLKAYSKCIFIQLFPFRSPPPPPPSHSREL